MKLLICAATKLEVLPLIRKGFEKIEENLYKLESTENSYTLLISGVGITSTSFELTKFLILNKIDKVINIGIAGAYNKNVKLGEIFEISSECFADFGITTMDGFLPMHSQNFYKDSTFDSKGKINSNTETGLKPASSNTVNSCTGSEIASICIQADFPSDIENMEGASVFYVCKKLDISCTQIRSISNHVGERDKEKWEIEKSIVNLNSWIIDWLEL
jgi:futalosine hydrolase